MLFIIFGANSRTKTVDKGEFFCPYERKTRPYARKKAALWVSLYFLPLFPIKQQGEIIECQSCGRTYDVDVLTNPSRYQQQVRGFAWQSSRSTDPVKLVNELGDHLRRGVPVEYLISDLTAVGYDHQAAVTLVNSHLGAEVAYCHTCTLTYAPHIEVCTMCGETLSR